jgi:hypothetical protein
VPDRQGRPVPSVSLPVTVPAARADC